MAWESFLEGAGLSAADARGLDAEVLLRELGGRYRAMAGGLVAAVPSTMTATTSHGRAYQYTVMPAIGTMKME